MSGSSQIQGNLTFDGAFALRSMAILSQAQVMSLAFFLTLLLG